MHMGLIQTSGYMETLKSLHDPVTGWPLNYPEAPCDILLIDDLTFVDNKIVEIENYIKHYGYKIKDVVFYVWHQNINKLYPNLNFVYHPIFHWNHCADAIKHNVADKFKFITTKEFVFLCLNMNRRKHRDIAVKALELFPSRLISYKSINWHLPYDDWDIATYNNANLQDEKILRNTANLFNLYDVYRRCQFSVVTETRYNLPFDFVTEKTTQCWLALHPALYISNKGHVQLLREWGFDVFDDIFDHSYDLLDDDKRISHLVNSNHAVLTHGITAYHSLKDRLLKNRNHYLNNFTS